MILLLAMGLSSPGWPATLEGFVLDADGAPVPSVSVVVYDARLSYDTVRSGSDGGFELTGVGPGRYRLRAMPPDADPRVDRFLPDAWDYCDAEVVEVGDSDVAGLDFALPRGGSLAGRVLTLEGSPVIGAQVLALGQSDRSSMVTRLGVTDSAGAFNIVGLDTEPGVSEPYTAYVVASGFPRQYLGPSYAEDSAALHDVVLGAQEDAGDQVLLDGITVTGRVAGPAGPVGSGTVNVYSPSQVLSVPIALDGTYVADGLPPGQVLAWAASPGLATSYYPDVDRPGERVSIPNEGGIGTIDLTLPTESLLSITLTGADDLSEASVLLYNDTSTVGRGGELTEGGVFVVEALHPGTYFLQVYGAAAGLTDDYARNAAGDPLPIEVDGPTAITVAMPAGASFTGRVHGDDGQPIYGAYVSATSANGANTRVDVTDADGTYVIQGLPGSDYTLKAEYKAYCHNDRGWTTVYWPDHLSDSDATITTLTAGQARTGVDFMLFADDDQDKMGDRWEADNGLDPHRDDSAEDPDEDGYSNLEEWVLGTDPTDDRAAGLGGCGKGCGSGAAALALMLPLAMRRRHAVWTGTPRSRALRW